MTTKLQILNRIRRRYKLNTWTNFLLRSLKGKYRKLMDKKTHFKKVKRY